jgi:DNA replication and repair protein RecF
MKTAYTSSCRCASKIMSLALLNVGNFRNLTSVQITPVQTGLNIICGTNGSGKTSLLEAIYYMGHGKSFRSSIASRLINHHADKFSLFSQMTTDSNRLVGLGMERQQSGSTRLRIDERDTASLAEIASYLPIRLIDSHSHQLLEGGPAFRRKYLDWGLFYHQAEFIQCWRQFERVLKQRNAILRSNRPRKELEVWTSELIKHGLELNQYRLAYIASLLPHLQRFCQDLLGMNNLSIQYQSGWDTARTYEEVLQSTIPEDYGIGYTQAGPHRADFELISEGLILKHILSRGQQKLLICAMILAQGMLLAEQEKSGLIYLIDDLPSELDIHSRQRLVALLTAQKSQIFITAIEKEAICDLICDKAMVSMKVFHVEHGKIAEHRLDTH